MKGGRNHQNDCDQQGHIGPLDVIYGGHDTCAPLHSRYPVQLPALLTEAFELWFHRHRVATLVTDKQTVRARQHWFEVVVLHAVWTANDLNHFELSPSEPLATLWV
jgi:hypothetical protein